MSDLYKDLKKNPLLLDQFLSKEIIYYWENYGIKLKNYRDLAQHFANITSDARLFRDKNGEVALYLLLPSNPEAKNVTKLIYGSPVIHVTDYVFKQFKYLYGFVFLITFYLYENIPKQINPDGTKTSRLFTDVFREPVIIGGKPIEGCLQYPNDIIKQELSDLPADLSRNAIELIQEVEKKNKPNFNPNSAEDQETE